MWHWCLVVVRAVLGHELNGVRAGARRRQGMGAVRMAAVWNRSFGAGAGRHSRCAGLEATALEWLSAGTMARQCSGT